MCGIVGYTGPTRPGELDEASAALAHRGPDGHGTYSEPPIHLGHRRLAIQDPSAAAHQPMTSRCGRYTLVYNGEIYNAPELRLALQAEGCALRSTGDSEVLLESYVRRGEALFAELNGIFALAIWDHEAAQLVLARDHFGVKPLYYSQGGGQLFFASELKGLLRFDAVERAIDPVGLEQLLTFLWVPQPRTILTSVQQIPPAHYAVYRPATRDLSLHRYWDLLEDPEASAPLSGSRDELAERAEQLLEQAVRRQLLSDVPVGAFLSGGLDSSAVVAMMRRASGAPIRCYSIALDAGESGLDHFSDDLPYARQVARHLDVELDVVDSSVELVAQLETLLGKLDEPIADPAAFNAQQICARARARGDVVLLTGVGGDELFAGYRRHLAIHLGRRLGGALGRGLALPARALGRCLPAYGSGRLGAVTRRARKLLRSVGQPLDEQLLDYCSWSTAALRAELLAPLGGARPSALDAHRAILARAAEHSPLKRALYLDLATFMPSLNLTYTDRMSMSESIEARVPFLDLDLVRFAWRVPDHLLIHRRSGKHLLKHALRGALPAAVIDRPKTGFFAPLRHWVRHDLGPLIDRWLAPERLAAGGRFDPAVVARILADNRSQRQDHAYLIWALLCFEVWCDSVLER